VVMRNVFGTGFLWGDPLVRHLVLWSGFFGASLAASQERHISIDALTKFFSPRIKHWVQVLTNLFATVVCYFLGSSAWGFMIDERSNGGEAFLSIPSWIPLLIIPIGYWLLALHFLLNSIDNAAQAVAPSVEEAH